MSIWYIVIGGQQQGPLPLDDVLLVVREKGAGNVHVYREGFTDWKLANEVADITRRLNLLPPLQTDAPDAPAQPSAPPTSVPSQSSPPASVPTAGSSRAVTTAAPGGNFIVRHWRGELPLWMAYWIVTILGHFFILGVQGGILGRIGEGPLIAIAAPVAFVVSAVIELWILVGLWRSAVNHKRTRRNAGRAPFWGVVVQALIVAWIAIWIGGAIFSVMGTM